MDFESSETYQNLIAAYTEESKVRNKYEMFAQRAESDGLYVLSNIFQKTADNEKEHAELWYKTLCDGQVLSEPDNLAESAKAEHYEHDQLYAGYAKKAMEEGYSEISEKFQLVAEIEQQHAQRFDQYIQQFNSDTLLKKETPVKWICTKCGHIYEGAEAPMVCPVCSHSKGFFDVSYEQ
ncbi:MAG: rubrerythrin family protein [Eubacteriaceae bacterium]|jgi:rubrerythrin|nr:rubrerythrin family protein [Eubacteriaceae bacterium]